MGSRVGASRLPSRDIGKSLSSPASANVSSREGRGPRGLKRLDVETWARRCADGAEPKLLRHLGPFPSDCTVSRAILAGDDRSVTVPGYPARAGSGRHG